MWGMWWPAYAPATAPCGTARAAWCMRAALKTTSTAARGCATGPPAIPCTREGLRKTSTAGKGSCTRRTAARSCMQAASRAACGTAPAKRTGNPGPCSMRASSRRTSTTVPARNITKTASLPTPASSSAGNPRAKAPCTVPRDVPSTPARCTPARSITAPWWGPHWPTWKRPSPRPPASTTTTPKACSSTRKPAWSLQWTAGSGWMCGKTPTPRRTRVPRCITCPPRCRQPAPRCGRYTPRAEPASARWGG